MTTPKNRPAGVIEKALSGSAGSSTRSAASRPAPARARSRPSRRSAPAARSAANQARRRSASRSSSRRGALEHRRELPARLAVGDEMDQHRRKDLLLLQRARRATRLRARGAPRRRAASRSGSIHTTSRAASSARSSGAPLPVRIASVLAKRAVSSAAHEAPATGRRSSNACQRARNARAAVGERKRDAAATTAASQIPAGRAKERARRDQRLREPRQRLPALLVDGDDLRHDVDQQHRDHGERDDRDERRIDERERELLPQRLARLEIVGEPREHLGQPPGLGADGDQAAIELREGARIARQRGCERLARGDLRRAARRRASPRARRRPARRPRPAPGRAACPSAPASPAGASSARASAADEPRAIGSPASACARGASIAVGVSPSPRSWSRTGARRFRIDAARAASCRCASTAS